jgi:hypothetical protein
MTVALFGALAVTAHAGSVAQYLNGFSVTLDSVDSVSGTIAVANMAPGQYCVGLNADNPNDPIFTLTFQHPGR